MFTGIICEIGILEKRERKDQNLVLTIKAPETRKKLSLGSSIAVNGVCLTVENLFQDAFKVLIIPETERLTNLGTLRVSSPLNLEPSLAVDGKIDGHFVTGHVDGLGKVIKKDLSEGGQRLTIEFPEALAKFLSLKGSVAVNGVSLTIANLEEHTFDVALVPFTQQNTNLGLLQPNDLVNIEVDLVARYLDRLLSGREQEIRYEWLKERNLI